MINLKAKRKVMFRSALFLMMAFLLSVAPSTSLAASKQKSERTKVIDFDGDLVEGMNKRPFDSLSQVGEANKRRKASHLYRKRKGFRTEIKETVQKMRYTQ